MILVVTSAIGLFYYLRMIILMYGYAVETPSPSRSLAPAGAIALGLLTAALVFFGVFPGPLLHAIRSVIADLA